MEVMAEIFKHFIEMVGELFSTFWGIFPKVLSLFFWILVAVFVLPCVFIANTVYPKWVEWGEDF